MIIDILIYKHETASYFAKICRMEKNLVVLLYFLGSKVPARMLACTVCSNRPLMAIATLPHSHTHRKLSPPLPIPTSDIAASSVD